MRYLAVVDETVIESGRTVRELWDSILALGYGWERGGYVTNQDGGRASFGDLRDRYGTDGYGACGVEGCEDCK